MSTDKVRILVVDDEAEFRELVGTSLTAVGFAVLEANSGKAAQELLSQSLVLEEEIGLVISDCRMPNGDGFELLAWIRSGEFKSVPMILISGALSHEEIARAARQQPVAILVKPFRREALLAKISELLARTRRA
ncbi:MAG: response regulator [Bdellovibrionales bacterium]|nr:response regulator [Bdellovibrionales bacterium]